jgi:hypothetical protein
MTIAREPSDPFTPEAARRWKEVPRAVQQRILDNVWCGQCLASVPILLEMAEMDGDDLVLRGKCRNGGAGVCRMVEGG